MFKKVFKNTFGIRDGEIYISFLMQLYIFLIITVLLIIKPTVNALFLSNLGANQLPYGYLLVAIIAVVVVYFYNQWVKQFSFKKVAVITIIFFSLSFMVLGLTVKLQFISSWIFYLCYIGVSLFALITTSQFWILANLVFNSREAKRLFGFIGAGAIAGGIFGGYVTSFLVSHFGNEIAIFLAALLLISCIPIVQKIYALKVKKLNIHMRALRRDNNKGNYEPSYKVIAKSNHLTYLAIITGIGVIVAKLIDYQFSDFASASIPNSDKLASFFGFWFSSFNLVALALQLFLTNKILSKLGVCSTLLVLPVGIAMGCLLFFIFPELWVLIIIKGIDGSFKQSLNKAAFELSIIPIPFTIKNQAKSFIDVAVDSIATGIAGLMLILFIKRFDISATYIIAIVVILVLISVLLIHRLRKTYIQSFRLNIQRNLASINDSKLSSKQSALHMIKTALKSKNEKEILLILEGLSTYKLRILRTDIIALLHHKSDKIKAKAIKQLYDYDKGQSLSIIKPLIFSHNSQVSYAALEYLLKYTNLSETEFFEEYLNHKNQQIATAALLCLAKEVGNNERLKYKFSLKKRIESEYKKVFTIDDCDNKEHISKLMLTIAHANFEEYYSFINTNLNHENPYIIKYAIKAAGVTANDMFTFSLINHLSKKEHKKQAVKALKNYGSQLTETLLKLSDNDELQSAHKRHIPQLIKAFNNQNSVKILIRFLQSKDIVTRFESSKALIKLKSKNKNLYFNKRRFKKQILKEYKYAKESIDAIASMKKVMSESSDVMMSEEFNSEIKIARESIIDLLDKQLQLSLKCIFKLLGLLYDESDIEVSYSGLISDVKEAKINALEFLENLLKSQIKSQLLPLIEYYSIDAETSRKSTTLSINIKPEKQIIELLSRSREKQMMLELLQLIRLLNDKSYLRIVRKLTTKVNKDVQELAIQTEVLLLQK